MMKKLICALLALLLALPAGFALAEEKTTTVLVYMCGADLQSDACEDLVEMAMVEAGDAINMVILAGGAEEWDLEDLKGNSRTLAVIRDGYFEETTDWGRKSMGSADSLQQFLEYGLKNYPADRTIVILWNHGAGSEGGVCFDETANDDSLTPVEIDAVLDRVEQNIPDFHIDIFGCDACMMATYEMAAMLSHHDIDFFVASEELEPGTGWNYTPWLDAIREDPSISTEDICANIIESYMEAGLQNDPDDYLTLSSIRLSAVGALESRMEQFASALAEQVQAGNISAVRRGRSRMYTFGSFADGSWDMVDLGAVLDAYAQYDSANASEAKRCLRSCVLYSSQTDNLDTCSGLSILLPEDTASGFEEYKDGFNLTDVIPNWVGFLNDYVSGLAGGSGSGAAITGISTCQMNYNDVCGNSFVSIGFCTSGCLAWDDEDECYGDEIEAEEIEISDTDQGFTAVLSQENLANLDYVEGMLLMDVSDEDLTAYVDFGLMQNNLIDWNTGVVVSLYDGTWPCFGGQIVPIYDQTSNEHSRRSLIPVRVNGKDTYLVVIFPAGGTEGRIAGTNAGYDANGLPIRHMTRLQEGDVIVPVYTMYYDPEDGRDLQEEVWTGEEVIWHEGMTVTYEDMEMDTEDTPLMFCFVFNDIFGEESMSEFISFTLE